jgi:glycosyltransferase involved in cell wall biosynthesis
LKILFWADTFYPTIGGRETQILQCVTGLCQKGHFCLVLAQSTPGSAEEERIEPGLLIRRFDFNRLIAGESELIQTIRTYLQAIKETFAPDLLHLDSGTGGSLIAFSLFYRLFSVPTLMTVHGPSLHHRWFSAIAESLLPSFRQIIGVSKWVISELAAQFPHIQQKLRLIYNGLRPFQIIPPPLPFDPPVVLLCGRLSLEKGFTVALHAFARLKKLGSPALMHIAGEGLQMPIMKQLIEHLSISSSVTFLGAVRGSALIEAYCRATLLLVPSWIESFSLVTLEAMQLERAVIASRVGGIPELLFDGVTGRLVPMRDPEALFCSMKELLDNPRLCVEMGCNGRKRALELFNLERHVAEYESVYAECCSPCL